MLKIGPDGHVSDSAAVAPAAPFFEQLADVKAELAEANAEVAELEAQEHPGAGEPIESIEAPADGTPVTVGNDPVPGDPEPEQVTQLPAGEAAHPVPAAPPRVPPRRVAPGAAGD